MEISEVTPDLYKTIINKPSHAFNSAEFSNLNAPKCEKVHYLLFSDLRNYPVISSASFVMWR
jgi:hypothetical protein